MKFFPESTLHQLEFDKVKELLAAHARTEYGKQKALQLRIHTKKEFIDRDLQQGNEYKQILQSGMYFPNDFILNISRELKLLGIPGASLTGEQFLLIRRLAENTNNIFRWFTVEMRDTYSGLTQVIENNYYEKAIRQLIDEVLDETGVVKDTASPALAEIRMKLYRKRNELRRVFDRIVSKLNKQGYLADIEESFMNGRRVLAVFAEQKRMVKGVLHSESDSRRTSFIEPEETTDLNNEIFSLEYEETKEVYRILRQLTQNLSVYAELLKSYHALAGEFDFIRAKGKLAIDINGNYPQLQDKAHVQLIQAYHPLLLLYNQKNNKPTIPVNITLDDKNSILVISGPNAGGKTVTLKTVGLLQVMLQSGLLVSVSPDSTMGIFKQLMIHIGDTQSLEFELSTYSSHLKNMKYFIENANGKTLFFIDELGSGSDPNLGGAFAEVIMEELAFKHAFGIVTTHYLNLKVMANKVAGIINGAMQFDEANLLPMYKLQVGKPGSSYTFSIAERIGLDKRLISKARKLVDEDHFRLDKLLNRTEQDLQKIDVEKDQLDKLLKENEQLKKEMQRVLSKELHRQEVEKLQHQNKISQEKIDYLKDMERRLKTMVIEWRKSEDKDAVVKMIHALLFNQKEQMQKEKHQKKLQEKFEEVGGEIVLGAKVKMKNNRSVGIVKEIRGKKAILQIGVIPVTVDLADLVVVKDKSDTAAG
ncbi:MAG: mismatch repair protein MutS [Ferruginibacter sp.]|nr:mismatch repair protein MutS [Ferruginibacter sp.]